MTPKTRKQSIRGAQRAPLDRERVLEAALALADEEGIEALSMRRLGQRLGVEAMSLYNHVANKEEVLTGILDRVLAGVDLETAGPSWQDAMRTRARSLRQILARHPWAVGQLESNRTPGPATLRYCDSVLGVLRRGGFSPVMAGRAFWVLDSYIYGCAIQQQRFASSEPADVQVENEAFLENLPEEAYPNLAEVAEHFVATEVDLDRDFDRGLNLLLEALEAWRGEGREN